MMRYNRGMSKDVSFYLDPSGGKDILEKMAAGVVKQSATAIAGRARSMAASISSKPPSITVESTVGTIRRGTRAISTVRSTGPNARANYVGYTALTKAKDAGRVS